MDMFPTATAGKPQVIGMVETTEELPIYCACGQPDDGMEMIQCDKCQVCTFLSQFHNKTAIYLNTLETANVSDVCTCGLVWN